MIDWDPTAGAFSSGRYSVTIDGSTSFVDLTAPQRAIGVSLDSFGIDGLDNFSSDDPSEFATFFIDDVTFTTVPEPSACGLAAIAGVAIVLANRRLRKRTN